MKLPGLSFLKDKWVWIGLAAGAGVYLLTNHRGYSSTDTGPSQHTSGNLRDLDLGLWRKGQKISDPNFTVMPSGYSLYDRPGLYEVPNKGFENMRFSGQAELQRRLTVV